MLALSLGVSTVISCTPGPIKAHPAVVVLGRNGGRQG